jgi:hypothetical protein
VVDDELLVEVAVPRRRGRLPLSEQAFQGFRPARLPRNMLPKKFTTKNTCHPSSAKADQEMNWLIGCRCA